MRDIEILNANLLDIIFENRNKNYGAYALRKFYPSRLTKSVGVSLGLVLFLFVLTLFIKKDEVANLLQKHGEVIISDVQIPQPKDPEKPRPVVQQRTATAPLTTKIVFTNETIIATQDDFLKANVGTTKIDAPPSDLNPIAETQPVTETTTPVEKKDPPPGITCDAQYPGGKEKFTEFLKNKLSTPEDLEAGQKQKVLVRFKVDVDGSISQIEVIESGGVKFDNEVIRVMKKMPKWSPAMQNGIKVSSYFIQVVTFIGQEQ
jgi:protein TonB